MFAWSPTILLGLALLAALASAAAPTPFPDCAVGTRYIELTDASSKTPELCIGPGLSITLFFDVKLAGVEVEGRGRFRRVELAEASLSLVASDAFADGERVRVTVYFQDDAAPEGVTFVLVVHPSQAERQVEVSLHERTPASYKQGEQQARAEALQCREEKARLQAECGGQGGLTGLIANRWMNELGVAARVITDNVTQQPIELLATRIISYRAVGFGGKGRVAVEVELFNQGTVAWTPRGAALVGARNETLTGLSVWPLEPIPPGQMRTIVVEMNAAESEARGTFTLKLWAGDAGVGGVNLHGVTFP